MTFGSVAAIQNLVVIRKQVISMSFRANEESEKFLETGFAKIILRDSEEQCDEE
jgi:hypothetical protein